MRPGAICNTLSKHSADCVFKPSKLTFARHGNGFSLRFFLGINNSAPSKHRKHESIKWAILSLHLLFDFWLTSGLNRPALALKSIRSLLISYCKLTLHFVTHIDLFLIQVPGLNSADLSKMIKESNKTSTSNCSRGTHEHKCCSPCWKLTHTSHPNVITIVS